MIMSFPGITVVNRAAASLVCVLLVGVSGCGYIPTFDEIFPDPRDSYTKGQVMTSLEAPPDLSQERITPLEKAEGEGVFRATSVSGKNTLTAEALFSTNASRAEVWEVLQKFFAGQLLTLDDIDIGVLETDWQVGASTSARSKYRVFVQEKLDSAQTILLVGIREEREANANDQEETVNAVWESVAATKAEKGLLNALLSTLKNKL